MRLSAALFALVATAAHAATPTTDFSDLWYNSDEEGWGVNLIQQNEVIFLTMFVYGANGQPTWYVSPQMNYTGQSNGIVSFTGVLYATTGPYFGLATFDESQVTSRVVGGVSFAAGQLSVGALSYTVDTVPVTKSIVRQTWRNENVGGTYVGATIGSYAGCGAARNGYFEFPMTLTIGHDGGSTISMREEGDNYSCNYNGTYTQAGRLGQIQGFGTCSDGTNQTFTATEVQGGIQGLTMRFGSSFSGGCSFVGRMGGMRRDS